ncbi:hypothetical protein KC334_g18379, partial [Hortaea werneckii]
MSGRQYGVQPGYRHSSPARSPVSPMASQEKLAPGRYRRSNQQSPARSTNRAAMPPVGITPPPPPAHRTQPASPSPTRPPQDPFSPARPRNHGAAGVGYSNAARRPPSFEDSDPFGMQALRDIDNLYGGRMMSPSPEPEDERPFRRGAPAYSLPATPKKSQPAYSPDRGAQRSYGMSPAFYTPPQLPEHRQRDSQSSIAPLMAAGQNPMQQTPPSQRPDALQRAPISRGQSYNDDAYHDFDPNDIADDGDDVFDDRSRERRCNRPAAGAGLAGGAAAGGLFRSLSTRSGGGGG